MSDKLAGPRDLFLQQLAQILWVERTLAFEVLPELHKQVQSETLAAAVEEHLEQTHEHVARVESAFRALDAEPASARSAAAAGLKQEHEELQSKLSNPRLADLFHAGSAIATEHLELAAYELLLELARALDRDDVERTLAANRADESETLDRLEGIAESLREGVEST
jgi:ferritin-like metal-binding protein YciE